MSWNSILHLKRKHALVSGERSLKWEARSDLQDFLSIKVSFWSVINEIYCGNHSSLKQKWMFKQSKCQRCKITVCTWLVFCRNQKTKEKQDVSCPRNTSWILCWFHNFLGWDHDFLDSCAVQYWQVMTQEPWNTGGRRSGRKIHAVLGYKT